MSIFPNLSAEMTRFGVSTKDIAIAVGRHPRTINNWISGRTEIRMSDCVEIRDKCFSGLPTEYLFAQEPMGVGISDKS